MKFFYFKHYYNMKNVTLFFEIRFHLTEKFNFKLYFSLNPLPDIICNSDLVFKKIPRLTGSISMRRSYHSRKRFFRKLFAPLQR